MVLSRQSVRRILRTAQISSPQKRRAPMYRSRRDRREQEGPMGQTDASHDWLEGRRPIRSETGAKKGTLQIVILRSYTHCGWFGSDVGSEDAKLAFVRPRASCNGLPANPARSGRKQR